MPLHPPARPRAKRSPLALALEPRILLDAAALATAADVAAAVDASASAPGVAATPNSATLTIDDGTTQFADIDLFDNVQVQLDGNGEPLQELVIHLDTSGSNQALVIDGTQILLQSSESALTRDTGYQYQVAVSAGSTTITVSIASAAGDASDVASLIDGMAYRVLDKSVESGTVEVTLRSLSDSGGESADLSAIGASVTLDNRINVAPVLSDNGSLEGRETFSAEELGLGSDLEVAYSANGAFAYLAGSNGIQVFAVGADGALSHLQSYQNSALGSIAHLVASADGKSLYSVSGNTEVIDLRLDADGRIASAVAVSSQNGEINGGLAISADGSYLYAGTANNDVVVYRRDTSTGELSYFTRAIETGNSRGGLIITSADRVFILYTGVGLNSAPSLAVYQHGSDGKLVQLTTLTLTELSAASASDSLALSADGQYLYIGDPGKDVIAILRYADGELSRVGSVSMSDVTSLAMAADGTTLYALGADGRLNVYAVAANGSLALSASQSGSTPASDLSVSAGGSLLLAGSDLTRYTRVQSLTQGSATVFASTLSLRDANLDVLGDGAGNYNGASLSVVSSSAGGTFGFVDGNGLARSGDALTLDGTVIARFVVGQDGRLAVAFSADTSKAVANRVLQQLTYSAAPGTATGTLVTLAVVIGDGQLSSSSHNVLLRVNTAPQADAAGYTPPLVTSETDYRVELPASLFDDADGDRLTWRVDGLPAGLVFDPLTRMVSGSTTDVGSHTLTVTATDTSGTSASLDLQLQVEQIGNRAPEHNAAASDTLLITVGSSSITLDAALFSDQDQTYGDSLSWALSDLPPGLTFDPVTRSISGTTSQTGDYAVTVSVTDAGGLTATAPITLRVISQAEADNSAPTLSVDSSTLVYTANSGLSGYSEYVYSIQVSADGRSVLVVGNGSAGHAIAPGGGSSLNVYSRDPESGVLTLQQRFVQGTVDDGDASNGIEVDGLNGATSAVYSSDGTQLYLVGQQGAGGNYQVSVFAVGADGTLSATGQSADAGATQVKQLVMAADGSALYGIAGNTLLVFGRDADGALANATVITDSTFNTASAIATDAQGTVYVLGGSRLIIYQADGNGGLTRATDISGNGLTNFSRGLAVSDSGYLYVASGTTGNLLTFHYDRTGNSLSAVQSSATGGQAWGVALSADGSTLFVGNNTGGVRIYSIGADGKPVYVKSVTNSDYRSYRIAVSADGNSLYAGGFFTKAGLGLISISDAAQLDYSEGQAESIHPAANLSIADLELDALANGTGNYQGAVISLVRAAGASADDRFDFSTGNGLARVGDAIQLDGATIATFSSSAGTLTLTFVAETSTAVANQVLRQIAYANVSNDPPSSIELKLTVQDDFKSGTSSRALIVTVAALNDAPTATAAPLASVQEPGKTAAALFSDTVISAVEASQSIIGLTFSVTGLHDGASEALVVDGTRIALVEGSGSTASGLTYSVTVSDAGVTLQLSHASGIEGSAAAALVDGLRYAHDDSAAATLGQRSVTLSAVQDNGGTANGGSDRSVTAIAATVTVSRESPELGAEVGALELAELVQSGDWPNPYAGINGVVSVDDLVYVLRSTSEWVYDESSGTGSEVPLSTLYVFQRAADGTLSLRDTLAASADNGLDTGTSGLGLSGDGATLFLTSDTGSVLLFGRDAQDGSLSLAGHLDTGGALVNDVLVQGDTVYVTSQQGLGVFQRSADGWSELARQQAGETVGYTALQTSPDGSFLFAAASGGSTLVSVFGIAGDGSLTLVGHLAGGADEHYANALGLSPDGKSLYVADGESLYSLSVGDNGQLTRNAGSLELGGSVRQLIVSTDGSALLVVGENRIGLYARAADGSLSQLVQIDGAGALQPWGSREVPFSEVRSASLGADGTQLYLTGNFGSEGLLVLDLRPQAMTFGEGGQAVAILPGGTLADPQLDALGGGLGDYDGASIIVERADGAQTEDVFGLLAGNGLSLVDGQVLLDGRAIASFVQDGGRLTLTFIASLGTSDAQNVLRSISYRNDSRDPAGVASLRLTLNDGDGYSDSTTVEVAVDAVNDAPEVSTDALQPTYNAESEAVRLFDNTQIDLIESGQSVWQLILTLEPAATGDIIGVEGGRIALDGVPSGVQTSASGQQYQVRVEDGKTLLVLYINGDAERAAQVVDSLTYSNAGDDLSGTRSISLSVKDSGGGSDTGTAGSQASVTLAPALSPNTAPSLGGTAASVDYTEQAAAVLIAPAATLADTQMDAFNGGAGNYHGAVLTISLGEGSSAAHVLGFQDGNGLSLSGSDLVKDGKVIGTLSVADGVMTIRFSDAAGQVPTTADAQNVLRQVSYANASDAPPAQVAVRIVLTDQRGLAAPAVSTTIAIEAINDAPVLGLDPGLSMADLDRVQDLDLGQYGLAAPTASAISSDGSRVYIADAQGRVALFSRADGSAELRFVASLATGDGTGGLAQLQLSADGKSLYALRADGNAILWFDADASGNLTLQATLLSDYAVDGGNLYGMTGIALSEDGRHLYLINSNAGQLAYFSRDTGSGALTYVASLGGDMWGAPNLWAPTEIVSRGDLVLVVTSAGNGSSLIVYQRDSEGGLALLGYSRAGEAQLSGLQNLAVSADGSLVYVASDTRIDAFRLDPTSGTLSHLGGFDSSAGIRDIALSADAQALFVTLQDGTLQRYLTASGALKGSETIAGADQLLVTADGVLVLGSGASVVGSGPLPAPRLESGSSTPVLIGPAITLSDAELDAADNYQGASLTITGAAGDRFALQAGNGYSLDGSRVLRDGVVVATLEQRDGVATLTFSAALTRADATALVRQLTYTTDASGITQAVTRQLTLVFDDGDATDARTSNSQTLDITLLPPNQPPLFNDDYSGFGLAQAEAGKPYQVRLPADLFRDPEGQALSYSVSGLPGGMSFDPATGILSGTAPRDVGSLSLTVTVRDGAGQESVLQLPLQVVNSAPVADDQYELTPAKGGQAYSVNLPDRLFSDANDAELSWAIGELPGWLSYDPATRTLSGIAPASAEPYTIALVASDPHGASVSLTLTLRVNATVTAPGRDSVLPLPQRGEQSPAQARALPSLRLADGALNAPLFASAQERPGLDTVAAPTTTAASLLRGDGVLMAERGTLSQQLISADRVVVSDHSLPASGAFVLLGDTLRTSVDLSSAEPRGITLAVPSQLPDGSTPQRVTLANGLPLPSWASFDARTGELRLDGNRLPRDGVLRLTLISRNADGSERRTALEIRAEGVTGATDSSVPQPAPADSAGESLPERLRQDSSSALLSQALDLLDQLSDLAGEPVAVTTRHIA
ncbi:6-phosphogluconolactonase, cycloisomerase 2 family [Pseudomonas flavescens]|uniref:6-phosphogluconolactonase, cycloisomerase 2 family n=1 Tax=Phytopseudomonas flavescens TaxID=29435 RepID=A0A1G8NY89_9GAMM|nr:putative Ig domain-containing protein [Pseudomonas flavescens]SDI85204.1 6-phosphogluconolactonase, cycloisomerase 2 family [Pseudomonas flavescens]